MKISTITYQKKCVVCGSEFTASRNDAKFCADRCRKHYHKFIVPAEKEREKSELFRLEQEKQQAEKERMLAKEYEIKLQQSHNLQLQREKQAQAHERKLRRLEILANYKKEIELKKMEVLAQVEKERNELIQEQAKQSEIYTAELENYNNQWQEMYEKLEYFWEKSPQHKEFLKVQQNNTLLGQLANVAQNVVKNNNSYSKLKINKKN